LSLKELLIGLCLGIVAMIFYFILIKLIELIDSMINWDWGFH